MEILLRNGADPNDRIDGRSPMTFAKTKLNDPDSRQPFNECSPAGTDDDYKAVIDILNKHGGIISRLIRKFNNFDQQRDE